MERVTLESGLVLRIWPGTDDAGTAMLLMHGMVEHLGRYQPLIDYLNRSGITVAGFHYPGHGEQTPTGVMEPEMVDPILESIKEAHGLLRKRGARRLVHFAHSLGTFFTRLVIDELTVDHVILSGAAHVDPRKVRQSLLLVKILKPFMNRNKTHPWLLKLVFSDFLKPYPVVENGLEFISSLASEQQRYQADPLCGSPISIGFVETLLTLSSRLAEKEKQPAELDLPITLMSGQYDSIGDMGRAIVSLGDLLDRKNRQKSRVVLFDGRHEVLNDKSHEEMKAEILSICS